MPRTRPSSPACVAPPSTPRCARGDERHGGKLAAANLHVKFSLRVPHHASIYVRWTGGPTRQEVEAIANR